MKSRNVQKLFLIYRQWELFPCYHCNMKECRYLLQKEFVFSTWCFHAGFYTCDNVWSRNGSSASESRRIVSCCQGLWSSGFHMPTEGRSNCTFQPNSWIIKLAIWFQFLFFFLEGKDRLVMNSNLYIHFCGLKWKDGGSFKLQSIYIVLV